MQKYKVTQKQLKTRQATYYRATNSSSGDKVLVKKLGKGRTWEDLLNDKYINLMKLEKYPWTPKIIEIIKDQDRHYIVLQNLQTSLIDFLAKNKSLGDILNVAKRISDILIQVKNEGIQVPAVNAEYFFVVGDQIKLAHIPEGQQIDFSNASPQRANGEPADNKSLVFELGCLLFQALVGKPLIESANKQEFQQRLGQIFPQKPGTQVTKNNPLTSMLREAIPDQEVVSIVESMLDVNPSNRPELQTVSNRLSKFVPTDSQKSPSHKPQLSESLSKIDNNKLTVLRKCNQISIRFLEDSYGQLAHVPVVTSHTQPLPPEQNTADTTTLPNAKHSRNQVKVPGVVSPKMRQKGTQTLPKLFNRKQQHTNYAVYKHQHLGVESDQQGTHVFGQEKFINI